VKCDSPPAQDKRRSSSTFAGTERPQLVPFSVHLRWLKALGLWLPSNRDVTAN